MTTKYGDFVPPVFNGLNDPYNDASLRSDRDKGLAFIARVGRTGKTNDACFDKAKVLFEGEKHVDSSRRKLLANAEKRKLMLTDNGFKASSPMKLSTGKGDFQGTFGGKVPYIAGHPGVSLKKGDIPDSKPNLFTSPGKKGSYGTIKTTLSELRGAGGMHGEYKYAAEPYGNGQQDSKSNAAETPFIPTNPPKKGSYGWIKTNIGNKAHGTVGEFGYKPQGYGVRAAAEKQKFETPFVPPKAPKKGYNCTLSKYPLFAADPEHIRIQAQREARKQQRAKLAGSNPWHPPCIPKIGATRSVVRMNV